MVHAVDIVIDENLKESTMRRLRLDFLLGRSQETAQGLENTVTPVYNDEIPIWLRSQDGENAISSKV